MKEWSEPKNPILKAIQSTYQGHDENTIANLMNIKEDLVNRGYDAAERKEDSSFWWEFGENKRWANREMSTLEDRSYALEREYVREKNLVEWLVGGTALGTVAKGVEIMQDPKNHRLVKAATKLVNKVGPTVKSAAKVGKKAIPLLGFGKAVPMLWVADAIFLYGWSAKSMADKLTKEQIKVLEDVRLSRYAT